MAFAMSSTNAFTAPATSRISTAIFSEAPAATPTENNQAKYGKDLELPGTYVRCGRCATSYAIAADDLGTGKGRRIECGLCGHSWFQTPERLFTLNDGHELVPLPDVEITRIGNNVKEGRDPDFVGNNKFYVGNLDFGVEEDDLRALFADIGEVGNVSIITGPDGRSKGFAFVTMMSDEVTDKCMDLDGTDLNGRNINVKPPNN
ncbi:RNA binding protein fox-1 [Chaetoceros tenuissimus]|uniref:RNA binding protein fox-1 n=1 Tax=Chaetoceros tenuissimus TaxID=426638 RepID=A0AAD3CYP5_9STRA|nr:RNA binding protein fox-1 [Chaetoceros tenuissimus]